MLEKGENSLRNEVESGAQGSATPKPVYKCEDVVSTHSDSGGPTGAGEKKKRGRPRMDDEVRKHRALSRSKKRRAGAASVLYQILELQGFKCAVTGEPLTPENATLDHKTPIRSGGTNDPANLQWVLREVNRMKGSLEQSEFVEMCRKVLANQSGESTAPALYPSAS